jgi:hypothetical protein
MTSIPAPAPSSSRRRLIIGCGYLGERLAARWLAGGSRVWGMVRTPARVTSPREMWSSSYVAMWSRRKRSIQASGHTRKAAPWMGHGGERGSPAAHAEG